MSTLNDMEKSEFDHVPSLGEGKGKRSADAAHLSITLAEMPMAPTPAILLEAVQLAETSKTQRLASAFRSEYMAIVFCLAYILPAIGQGLDSGVTSITVNMPAFELRFGQYNPVKEALELPSLWLGLWNAMSSLGNAIGSLMTGFLTDKFGYRYAQIGGCVWSIAVVFIQVFAQNREMILVGKLLNGISMGMFVAVSAGYISEVAGPRTRATAMSVLAATPIVGIVCGVGIGGNAKIIGNVASDWGSWRLMMAIQWVFPVLAIPAVLLAPESPIRLVKQGRPEQALQALSRARPSEDRHTVHVQLANAQLTVAAAIEEARSQSSSYVDCFKGTDLKRTLTVIGLLIGAQLAGTALLSNGLYFLGQTGLEFATVTNVALAFLAFSAVVCVLTSFGLEKLGRRNTLLYGSAIHILLMTLVGALYYVPTSGGKLTTAVLFNFCVSTAQICSSAPAYALAIEVSSVRLRSKTQSLGFAAYYVTGWIFLFAVPYAFQDTPNGAGWGVRSCWLFAGLTLLWAVFAFFFVGETQGKSYADVDLLYHNRVSPRKFKGMIVQAEREAVQ